MTNPEINLRLVAFLVQRSDKTFKCILVKGARQTGKSTILKKLFDDLFIEDRAKENPDSFMALNQPPFVLDEAQRVTSLFRYIKIKCDEKDERGLFCLSGSQPFELMKNVSDPLSGRVRIIELCGLSLREIVGVSFGKPFLPTMEYVQEHGKTAKPPHNIWQIIHRGGYPGLQNTELDWGGDSVQAM